MSAENSFSSEAESRPQIGYIVKMFPRLSETFIRNEILELERQGLSLRIFSLKRPTVSDPKCESAPVRARINYLPDHPLREPLRVLAANAGVLWRFPRGYLRTLLHVLRGRELRSMARGLRRFCQTCCLVHEMGEVRHLHAHFATDPTRLASWARMICGISYSVTTHAKDLYQDDRIASPGLRFKLGAARFVVTNSEFSSAGLRKIFEGAAAPEIVTVYNSIDLAKFPKRAAAPAEPLILSVGRLIEKKGFADLIHACSLLKHNGVSFKCHIIGSGPLKLDLLKLIQSLSLQTEVILRGEMPHSEVYRHYLNATVFALPCVVAQNGDRDILPNVLKEAMAVGVPVVTTQLEAINELITNEQSGLLIPPGNPEALALALERLLKDSALRSRLSTQARQVIERRFDLQKNFTPLRALLLQARSPVTERGISAASPPDLASGHHSVSPRRVPSIPHNQLT